MKLTALLTGIRNFKNRLMISVHNIKTLVDRQQSLALIKMKRLIPILIVLLITGCKKLEMVNQHDSNYDILIAYNYYKSDSSFSREYKDREYLRDGNLYLIFESDFYKDTLIVSVNGKGKFSEIITTEASSGVAKHLKFENIETINTIGIRINNGKEAVLEIDTMNFFLVDYHDALLKIRVPKSVPFYE